MIISKIPIKKINPASYNPRKDLKPDDPEYQKLVRSLDEFGCVQPLVWNKQTGNLVGGHQRLKVIKDLGHESRWTSSLSIFPSSARRPST